MDFIEKRLSCNPHRRKSYYKYFLNKTLYLKTNLNWFKTQKLLISGSFCYMRAKLASEKIFQMEKNIHRTLSAERCMISICSSKFFSRKLYKLV